MAASVVPTSANGTTNSAGTPSITNTGRHRKQGKRCDHPLCGKYGHTVAECWKAHPELRPRGHHTARRARHGDGRSTNKTDANTAIAMTAATSFRFLDLPPEIRNRIYVFAYGEGYTLDIGLDRSKDYIRPEDPEYFYRKWFNMCAPSNLHLTNKKVHEESRFVAGWKADNSGVHLINHVCDSLGGNGFFYNHPFSYDEKYTQLCSKVTKITYPDWTVGKLWGEYFHPGNWDRMTTFPNLKEVHFIHSAQEQKYEEASKQYTPGARDLFQSGGVRAFLRGKKRINHNFRNGATRLKVWDLSTGLYKAKIKCKIFYTDCLEWCLEDGTPVFVQVSLVRDLCGTLLTLLLRRSPRSSNLAVNSTMVHSARFADLHMRPSALHLGLSLVSRIGCDAQKSHVYHRQPSQVNQSFSQSVNQSISQSVNQKRSLPPNPSWQRQHETSWKWRSLVLSSIHKEGISAVLTSHRGLDDFLSQGIQTSFLMLFRCGIRKFMCQKESR